MTKLRVLFVAFAVLMGLLTPPAEASPATDGLSRLYCAYFDRTPDPDGRVYWESMTAKGMVLDQVADVFADSPEYRLIYGNTTNTVFVARMYTNILGRDLDVGGHAYWLQLLDGGRINRGELMVQFSESHEYQSIVFPRKSKCHTPDPQSPSPTTPTPTGSLSVNSVSTSGAVISARLSECASVSWSISPGGLSASSGTCDNPHLMDTSKAGTLSPSTSYTLTATFTTAKGVTFRRTITFATAAAPPPPPTGSDCADLQVQGITEGLRFKVTSDARCTDFLIRLSATAMVNGSILPLHSPAGPPAIDITPGEYLEYDWDLSPWFACDGTDSGFTIDAWVSYGTQNIAEWHDHSLPIMC